MSGGPAGGKGCRTLRLPPRTRGRCPQALRLASASRQAAGPNSELPPTSVALNSKKNYKIIIEESSNPHRVSRYS
jgi:hypothetical protein